MLAVQETEVFSSNVPAADQLRKVASNLTNAPSDYNKIFHPGAPTRSSGAQAPSTTNQRPSTSYSSAVPQPQRPQRNRRPPLLETPCDPFETRSSNTSSGAIPKKSKNAEFWVISSDSTNLRPLTSTSQTS